VGEKSNIEKCIGEPVKRFRMDNRVLHLAYLEEESYAEALAAVDARIYLTPGTDNNLCELCVSVVSTPSQETRKRLK